jgi:tRNA threonylcarbamoyladenosine biosynthesis protein TsaE
MSPAGWRFPLPDEGQVSVLAQLFCAELRAPLVIYLRGDLGAGKTTFARSLIHALGYPGRVKSPTYGLLESYDTGDLHVLHLDLYRIGDPVELEYLALRDLFDKDSVLLIEWPERGEGFLPAPDLIMSFGEVQEKRFVHLLSNTPLGENLSRSVQQASIAL